MNPAILRPYQQRWLADRSPRRCWVKSRRIGGSFVASLGLSASAKGVDIYNRRAVRPANGFIFSASLKQAINVLRECAVHLKTLNRFGQHYGITSAGSKDDVTAMCVKVPETGCAIYAMSSKPGSARTFGGHVLWDEAGATPNAKALYQAIKPMTDPNNKDPEGYTLSIVGTALDDGSFFHELCEGKAGEGFSRHRTDIYTAYNEGNPADPATLRLEEPDEDRFNAEYMCQFMSAATRYISAEIYDRALFEPGAMPQGYWPLYGGMDVARKNDESVIVELSKAGDTLWQKHAAEREKNMPWPDQRAWVDRGMAGRSRFAVDKTGMGEQFSEELELAYRGKVEGVNFNLQTKEELATGIKLGLESGRLRLLASDIDLRRDVLSMRRVFTKAGNARYDVEQTERGHADGAWALGLAVHAAGGVAKGKRVAPKVTVSAETVAARPVTLPARRGDMFR